jgi:hypothetical protein
MRFEREAFNGDQLNKLRPFKGELTYMYYFTGI